MLAIDGPADGNAGHPQAATPSCPFDCLMLLGAAAAGATSMARRLMATNAGNVLDDGSTDGDGDGWWRREEKHDGKLRQ